MAQKRYLDRKISTSEKVADLPILGQLIYTWALSWADDFGLLQASPRTIKAQVIPMVDVPLTEVVAAINEMLKSGLWEKITIQEKDFYKIHGFENNQKFRNDINPVVIFPFNYSANTSENWEKAAEFVANGSVPLRHVTDPLQEVTERAGKIREDKIREDKIREDKINNITNVILEKKSKIFLGEEEITEFKREIVKAKFGIQKTTDKDLDYGMEVLRRFLGGSVPRSKSNRQALFRLYRDRGGKESVLKALAFSFTIRSQQYAPVVNDFTQLEHKWADLETYMLRQTTNKPKAMHLEHL